MSNKLTNSNSETNPIPDSNFVKISDIKNLVFTGGGFRGIAFIGALKHLETLNFDRQNIQKIVGTSSGSVFALLYSIGYNPDELLNIVLDINFKDLCSLSLTQLFKNLGLDSGQKILDWLKKLLEEKGISEDITFKEFKEMKNIEIYIICTNLNKYKREIMSWESTPDLKIIQAIRMSISVPFIFTPIKYNDYLYVDGALLSEFPAKLLKKKKDQTLIFQLNGFRDQEKSIENIYDFGYHIIKCIISKTKHRQEKDFCVLNIYTDQKDFLNFNMSASKKLELFNIGVKNAKEFYATL